MPVGFLFQSWPVLFVLVILISLFTSPSFANDTSSSSNTTTLINTLTEAEQAYLESRNYQLTFCAHTSWMPVQGISAGGEHQGIAAGLLDRLAKRLSVEFELRTTDNWPEVLQGLANGQCDLIPSVPASSTLERNPNIALTKTYYSLPTVVLGRIETPFFNAITELRGKTIGVSNHIAWINDLRLLHPGLNLQAYRNEKIALQQVQAGELYGYIGTLASTSLLLQELEFNDIRVLGRAPIDTSLAIAIHEQNTILVSILEKALATISADERDEIAKRWLSFSPKARVDYALLWKVLAGAFIAFALLLYWNRKLRRLNQQLARANHKLAEISTTDQLTGVGNRTYFEQMFEARFQACRHTNMPYLVAMIDADYFKQVNDRWGHEAGDACLVHLADILKSHFRDFDGEVVRFGGEEFVIFATITNRNEVESKLENLRAKVENTVVYFETNPIKLTISIGYCCATPQAENLPQQWFRAADRALYDAKDEGRNCVIKRQP